MYGKVAPLTLRPHNVHGRVVFNAVVGQLACALEPRGLAKGQRIRGLDTHHFLPHAVSSTEREAGVTCAEACAQAVISG